MIINRDNKFMIFGLVIMMLAMWTCREAHPESSNGGITEEQMLFMQIPIVITATKKEQKLSDTASAIYVVTQEDIHRSGVTSIPEALRMVPGIQVAHIDANKWAISSRGFNNLFSDKLLVMIDGQSVYTPLFAGVYWDVQDTLMEDIERIEVIRGPGATIWGANAVNGIVNIVTKNAKNTQGGLIIAGAGNEERGFGSIRYGGKITENVHYRVYSKYFNRDDFGSPAGENANDDWEAIRGGFRVDWDMADNDLLTLHGDIYNGHENQSLTLGSNPLLTFDDTIEVGGGNIQVNWKHSISKTSGINTQLYYNRTEREDATLDQKHNTFDFDFNHQFMIGEHQEMIWGLGYRFIGDNLEDNSLATTFSPDIRSDNIFSAFVQDEITLFPEKLRFTIGSKFEQNDYTGFEIQPSSRLLWTPHEKHSAWLAVSRAVRSPARFNNDIEINFIIPVNDEQAISASLSGDRDFESENIIAYEVGYRVSPVERLSFDIAAFYNVYDDLSTSEPGKAIFSAGPPQELFIPQSFDNKMDGETYGVEIASNFQITDFWKMYGGYTYLQMDLQPDADSQDTLSALKERDSPHHQFQIRSYLNLPYNLEFDTAVYYVEGIPNQEVSGYVRLDGRFGWKPSDKFEVSIVLQNLLDPEHKEFGSGFGVDGSEVERGIYGQITWKW